MMRLTRVKILSCLYLKLYNKKLQSLTENSDKWHKLKNEIAKIDKKIDQLVYKLYGLTQEEIKILESSFK